MANAASATKAEAELLGCVKYFVYEKRVDNSPPCSTVI